MKNLIFYVVLLLFLNSCGSVQDGFSRNKKDNTDEFLVEKKNPLKLPPDYEKLPLPNSGNVSEKDENNNDIEQLLNTVKGGSESDDNAQKKNNPSWWWANWRKFSSTGSTKRTW